ncbi:MAG TPA: hypothetical protein VMH87_13505 [Pseudomonadales bacterium]|nr:hypothetical protein [Pseudomonadales bacterium]
MKIFIGILAVICAILILFLVPALFEMVDKSEVPEMTPERAQKLFETAGGINKVNSEARWLFDHADPSHIFLMQYDLTNSPAILSLYSTLQNYSGRDYSGTSIAIYPEGGRHLEIKFGNHWSLKWIYIFDPKTMMVSNLPSDCFQITSNIFATR